MGMGLLYETHINYATNSTIMKGMLLVVVSQR